VNPGDVVVALLPGARVAKVRPAVVVSTSLYHQERPDAILGILTAQTPSPVAATDYELQEWHAAGLRVSSWFRLYLITAQQADLSVIGRVSSRDWAEIRTRLRLGLAV